MRVKAAVQLAQLVTVQNRTAGHLWKIDEKQGKILEVPFRGEVHLE